MSNIQMDTSLLPVTRTPDYVSLMIRKNIKVTMRNPKNLIFLALAPLLVCIFLAGFQGLATQSTRKEIVQHPTTAAMTVLPTCDDCYRLGIIRVQDKTLPEPDWVEQVVAGLKQRNKIESKDVWQFNMTEIEDYKQVQSFLNDTSKMRVQVGVLFCTSTQLKVEQFKSTIDCRNLSAKSEGVKQTMTYFILQNKTNSLKNIFSDYTMPQPRSPLTLGLKVQVDQLVASYLAKSQVKFNLDFQSFPSTSSRFLEGYDLVTDTGSFYFMIPVIFSMLFVLNELVREKDLRLRKGLMVYGVPHSSYWLSWVVLSFLYALIVSISTLAFGYAFQFDFFTETPFMILLVLFFCFCLSMQMLAYVIATASPDLKTANSVSYAFVLLAIVIQGFMNNQTILSFLFEVNASTGIQILRVLLCFYPPFNYSKIFSSITVHSGRHFELDKGKWLKGDGYSWDLFSKEINGIDMAGEEYLEYASVYSLLLLLANSISFFLLALYFDHVIDSNRGSAQSWLFFTEAQYWRRVFNREVDKAEKQFSLVTEVHKDDSIKSEAIRVIESCRNNEHTDGLRIANVSKTFTHGVFKTTSLRAVQNVFLEVKRGELLGMLGHNGAGKTTLINILTGIMSPDSTQDSDVRIGGESLFDYPELVRQNIGVCPQFDILWNEYTAREHLELFAHLKRIPQDEIDDAIRSELESVNLLSFENAQAGTFSGGMKRRLSMAIATLGNPKVVFLDEPTTGMDPKVRRRVWGLIQKIKQQRAVILTTHSMEEADILSDRIAIIKDGQLECIGSSAELKSRFGEGYRVSLCVNQGQTEVAFDFVKEIVPGSVCIDRSGGSLIIGMRDFESIVKFLKVMEENHGRGTNAFRLKELVKDWGVSNSSLEEVFINVTCHKK